MIATHKIRTHKKCSGFINGLCCPYAASCGQNCKLHVNSINISTIKTKKYSWVEDGTTTCHICAELVKTSLIGTFECNKHTYCPNCIEDASSYDTCPICLSLVDCISK